MRFIRTEPTIQYISAICLKRAGDAISSACTPWLPTPSCLCNPAVSSARLENRSPSFSPRRLRLQCAAPLTPPSCPVDRPSSPTPVEQLHCSAAPQHTQPPSPLLLKHAPAPTLPFLRSIAQEVRRQAATAKLTSKQNSRSPVSHSPIPHATSSYSHPPTHFAPLPSLCATVSSPRRAPSPRHRSSHVDSFTQCSSSTSLSTISSPLTP